MFPPLSLALFYCYAYRSLHMLCRCHILQHIRLCLCTSFCTTNRLTYLLSANLLWHRIKRPYHELNWKWTINYHFFTSLHTIIHIAVYIWWGDSLTFVQRTVYALVKEPQFNSNSNAQLQCSRIVEGWGPSLHIVRVYQQEHHKTQHYLLKPFP